MSFEKNPFDKTVWDPIDKEQAVEDPFHGPEAILQLLSTPPMPMEDGSYWVFGASSFVHTCTFDRNGKPYIRFSVASDPMAAMRFGQQVTEWTERVTSGDLPEDYPKNPAEFFDFTARPYFVVSE